MVDRTLSAAICAQSRTLVGPSTTWRLTCGKVCLPCGTCRRERRFGCWIRGSARDCVCPRLIDTSRTWAGSPARGKGSRGAESSRASCEWRPCTRRRPGTGTWRGRGKGICRILASQCSRQRSCYIFWRGSIIWTPPYKCVEGPSQLLARPIKSRQDLWAESNKVS